MKLKNSSILYTIPFFILLFQQAFVRNTTELLSNFFSYLDEIYVAVLLLFLFKKKGLRRIKKNRNDFVILVLWCIFLFIGLFSSLIARYVSVQWCIFDAFICSKFIILYFAIQYSGKGYIDISKIAKGCKFCIVSFTICLLINSFVPLFPKGEFRYFMHSVQLFFGHPTFFASASITCVCALIAAESSKKSKRCDIYIFLGLLCVFSSLRMKAVAASLGILFLYLYFIKFRLKNKALAFFMVIVVALVLGYDQIQFYYGDNYLYDDNFVRARMLHDSFNIANQHFPLGSGFGTFASDVAKKALTPLYSFYGYSYDSSYLTDSFWPIVISQFGWIGLIVFCGVIAKIIINIFSAFKLDRHIFCSSCSIMIYLIICTLGESAFFHPICVPMFIIIGINGRNISVKKETKRIWNMNGINSFPNHRTKDSF